MKSIKQQHEEVVSIMEHNKSLFTPYLGKKVCINMVDGSTICAKVKAVGGYFIQLDMPKGKIEYRNMVAIINCGI